MHSRPTPETYLSLEKAFEHFNQRLFQNRLPAVVFVLSRKPGMRGHFVPARWRRRGGAGKPGPKANVTLADEICLHPDDLATQDPEETLGVLVHQMVHQEQWVSGSPSRGGYHNHEWAGLMRTVGLIPTSTGEPGGRPVGQQVDHCVEPGGPFEHAAQELMKSGWDFAWEALPTKPIRVPVDDAAAPVGGTAEPETEAPTTTRQRYTCPDCGLNAWAKPQSNLMCGDCLKHLVA